MKTTWQRIVRKISWVDIIFLVIPTFILSICIITWISKAEEKQVPDIVETKEIDYTIYTLTDEKLSKLCTYHLEKRVVDENIVELDYTDAQLLMKIARAEGGPTLEGQLWSMRVILNRVGNESFGKTLEEVVFQKGQFEVVIKGIWQNVELNSDSHIALAMIEGGWDETDGALYFEASSNTKNSWHAKNLTLVKEVEGQRYYK